MAPLQKASMGSTEKGSSIWIPISSMPNRKNAMTSVTGTVAQWFHVSPNELHRPKGNSNRKTERKRAVWRVYTRGTGDLKTRSFAPVRSTSVEMLASMRERSMGWRSVMRTLADMALSMNIGRLAAFMHASACDCAMSPASTISLSSARSVSSSVFPRRKLRSALQKPAVSAANRRLSSQCLSSSGKKVFDCRTTLRQLLIIAPHNVRASFQRA
mmetsp:Transcript_44599/g.60957  ORF Transcript_44599/g.60957 Transcript_44599/m.60957 type:complete len:214 (-) Transcript_44599:539-1180(-)